jgi:signal transduction histidine kinase
MRTNRGSHGWGRFYAAGWLISAGVMAVTFRMWQLHIREVEERALEAERTKDEAARRRAVEERLRIARELHDSLTHSISVIQVQSGVAVHLSRKRGEEVPPALLAIEEASTDAARELRSTLGVLRTADDCDGTGLAHLDGLVARARAAGQPVTVTVAGTKRPLPADVDQAAYRIVQEALTNVSRHAGRAPACVRLDYGTGTLTVQVTDGGDGRLAQSGPAQPAPAGSANGAHASQAQGQGLGLIGMRERVSALGGRLRAGPGTDGGFLVRAELPVPRPS